MNNSKFTDMKLKIYEENASGNISDEERELLLEMIENKSENDYYMEGANLDIRHAYKRIQKEIQ